MAGGKGERLWPLSQPQFPKPLLPLYPDGQSLLQKTVDRLAGAEVLVVAPGLLGDPILQQLPELSPSCFAAEPLPRGTLLAAALVLSRLAGKAAPSTVVGFFPADHHIPDRVAFRQSLVQAEHLAREVSGLVTLGLFPAYPATGYGYIRPGESVGMGYRVEQFVEKPDLVTAASFLEQGGWYWNSGILLGRLEVWQREYALHAPHLLQLREADWGQTPAQSLDRGLLEKGSQVYTMLARFDWSDLGDWQALEQFWQQQGSSPYVAQALRLDSPGAAVFSTDASEKVLMVGLEGVIVVRAGPYTLVIRREQAQQLAQLVAQL